MTRDMLLAILRQCQVPLDSDMSDDPSAAHHRADAALIEFINDPEIAAAYEGIKQWYE